LSDGAQRLVVPAAPSLKLNPQAGFSFSAWLKPDGAQAGAVLFAQVDGTRSVQIVLDGSRAVARVVAVGAKPVEASAPVPDGAWAHLAVTLSNRLVVYVNGAEAGAAPAAVPDIGGDLSIGAAPDGKRGFRGQLDQVEVASVARSPDWIRAQFASQSPEGPFVAYGVDEESGGAGHSYFGILIDNLTLDAWIIIVLLIVMFLWSLAIMLLKALFLSRTERANQGFIEKFEELSDDLLKLDPDAAALAAGGGPNGHPAKGAAPAPKYDSPFWRSPVYRIYHAGVREVLHRYEIAQDRGIAFSLTPQAIEAIRAVLDARIVRENQRLNAQMVLLTIAISGGPFIGLLGTVLGVMITFAAVAAAGDVNVNAIAPGIAAALLATVAGLAVAIPALFGYNWLASRIKSVSNDMSVFADELLTKFAENYT
jgi:biopolymer transport protein ExbB